MRAIEAVCILLCCTCPASWAEGIDIKKRSLLGREELAKKLTELRQSIKAGEYQRAWDACAAVLLSRQHWGDQFQDAVFLARIALADPKVAETGRERLQAGIGLLKQFQERLNASDFAKDPRRMSACNRYFTEIAWQYGVLGIACGETRMATDLFVTAADLAVNADFMAIRKKEKTFLKSIVRYLVVLGKGEKAVELIERQWGLLGDDAWTVEGAPKAKEFIRACSLLQVANMMEDVGNRPAAARLHLRAHDSFGFGAEKQALGPKEKQVLRRARLAVGSMRSGDGGGEYDLWTSVPLAKYEDLKRLKETFNGLLDQLADAWVNQDVEAGLKLFKNPEKARRRLIEVFRREPQFRSIKLTVGGSLLPVKTTDTLASVVCRCTVILRSGEKRTGPMTLGFLREGAGWKIGNF